MSRRLLLILLTSAIAGCASLPGQDPLRVTLAGVESLPGAGLEVRFAVLTRGLDPLAVESLASRLKVPGECRDLALLAARHGNIILDAVALEPRALLDLFGATDAWRRPDRFVALLDAAFTNEADEDGARERLRRALDAASTIDAGAIARAAEDPRQIKLNVDAARLDAVKRALHAH